MTVFYMLPLVNRAAALVNTRPGACFVHAARPVFYEACRPAYIVYRAAPLNFRFKAAFSKKGSILIF